MCLFTHFAAGALAGGITGNPLAGLVAGLASHAVLDAIPHYDHPDWRLELAGGLFSLILLLFMPFASLAAVLGGLGGMLPDLENLFQKLGKMRRDQFVYPTHTGLIPHGRTLGPRSLVWQVAIFVVCFAVLGVLNPGQASAATASQAVLGQPQIQVLETGQDRTVLRVQCPVEVAPADWQDLLPEQVIWGLPFYLDEDSGPEPRVLAPRLDVSLAVPTRQAVNLTVSGVSWWREPDQPVSAGQLVRFGLPAVYRSVPLVGGEILLGAEGGILRSLNVTIDHRAAGQAKQQLLAARDFKAAGTADRWQEITPAGTLNGELFQALARGGRQLALQIRPEEKAAEKGLYNHFDLTDNWVKLEVAATGIYRITGQDLSSFGVAAAAVDPASLRVFQGGGLHLDLNPEIPEADQIQQVGLTEVAIQVLDGGDGEWNLDDELRFYGLASSVWKDRLDPAADRLEHYDHPAAAAGVYWVTWEDLAAASPLPGAPLRIVSVSAAATGGTEVNTARLRMHGEQQNVDAAGVVGDDWAWNTSVYSTTTNTFTLRNPVAGAPARFVIDFRGHPAAGTSSGYQFVADAWLNGDTGNLASTSFVRDAQHDSMRVRLVGDSDQLVNGQNSFTLRNAGAAPRAALALDSFDLFYWAQLDIRGLSEPFEFVHWGDQVTAPGQDLDLKLAVQDVNRAVIWDVTDPRTPRHLNGDLDGGPPAVVTLGVTRDPDTDLYLVAQDRDGLLEVSSGSLAEPIALRDLESDLDYLVIYAEPFQAAADNLADFHNQSLVGVASPRARAVCVDDIYDNFSGGRKDVMAIRNFLKYVFEDGHRLRYVCLLGNASRDFRNYKQLTPFVDLVDFVPAQLRTSYPTNGTTNLRFAPYASDDGLSSFNAPPAPDDADFPDLATGRLPATTVAEANAMVDIMITYGDDPPEGPWRNRLLMTSDDCNRPNHYPHPLITENSHTLEAELLTGAYIPGALDIQKVYGIEYDFPPGSLVKPQARADINAALNEGTTIFHYVGHGAEDNLADEQIFQSRDISNLSNGLRRSMFIAFSCDVGVYDNPIRRSMAELFVASESGGAIGSICASQVSYIGNNNSLANAFYSNLFPEGQVVDNVTVSWALMLAKSQMSDIYARRNSQRYTLFSDPGLRLPHPVSDMEFAATSVDTLRAGARQVVTATTSGSGALLGAGDSYDLRVEESAYDKIYIVNSYYLDYSQNPPTYVYTPFERTFVKLGSTVFRGSGTMDSNDLRVPFKVPTQLRYGDAASIRLLIAGPDGEHTAEMKLPAVRASIGPVDDVLGPSIVLSLPNRYRVRPGDALNAALTDSSGIAILGTSPGNSILLEFDNTGFMTEVTETFNYDPNSYTTGRMVFPLPSDISTGDHMVALHASDALGNVGSDTLSFTVAEYSIAGINDVTVFPNPTPGYCRLVFDLTDAMDIRWEIYTLSGRRVWSTRGSFPTGPSLLEWDGLDDQGDEIANGTYLYVLRGNYNASDGRELRETGKLVIMR